MSAMLQLLLSEFFYSLDGTDTLIETSAPALFVGYKPAEVDDPFALEGWLRFLLSFRGCGGRTHDARGLHVLDEVDKCVTSLPAARPLRSNSTASQKQTT